MGESRPRKGEREGLGRKYGRSTARSEGLNLGESWPRRVGMGRFSWRGQGGCSGWGRGMGGLQLGQRG